MFGCDGAPLREALAVLTTALAHLETFLHRIAPGKISTDRPATLRLQPGVQKFCESGMCFMNSAAFTFLSISGGRVDVRQHREADKHMVTLSGRGQKNLHIHDN